MKIVGKEECEISGGVNGLTGFNGLTGNYVNLFNLIFTKA
jgi:hypothetical protein